MKKSRMSWTKLSEADPPSGCLCIFRTKSSSREVGFKFFIGEFYDGLLFTDVFDDIYSNKIKLNPLETDFYAVSTKLVNLGEG